MSKSKKKKPANGLEVEFDFFVVENDQTQEVLVDYNAQTHTPVWGTDIDAAFWSTKENKVTTFISQQNIPNATGKGKNGDHPSQRPPL